MLDLLLDVGVAIVAVAAVWIVGGHLRKRRHQRLQQMAAALGLNFTPLSMGVAPGQAEPDAVQAARASPAGAVVLGLLQALPLSRGFRIDGRFNGVAVRIDLMGSGRSGRGRFTRLHADFDRPLPLALEITPRHPVDGLTRPTSQAPEQRIGVATLDDALRCRADDAAACSRLLAGGVRQALAELLQAQAAFQVHEQGVMARLRGVVDQEAQVRPVLERVVALARALQAAPR